MKAKPAKPKLYSEGPLWIVVTRYNWNCERVFHFRRDASMFAVAQELREYRIVRVRIIEDAPRKQKAKGSA